MRSGWLRNNIKDLMKECKTESGKDFRKRLHKRTIHEQKKKAQYKHEKNL